MNFLKNQIVVVVGLFAILAMVMSGCGEAKKVKKGKKGKAVMATKAITEKMVELLQTTGDVVAVNTVTLRAAVEGPIKYCPWREGDVIKKAGEVLIKLHRPIYIQELAVAKAELGVKKAILADLEFGPRPEEIHAAKAAVVHLESCTKFAKIDLDRIALLSKKNVISTQDAEKAQVNYVKCKTLLDGAKEKLLMLEKGTKKTELAIAAAGVEKEKANVEKAQAKLDECIIKAPFAGIITQVYVRPGDLTHLSSPRMPLLKMMDPKSLIVRTGLPENATESLKVGGKVAITLDAYSGKKFKGEIERIYPRIEWKSRARIVEIRILDKVKLIPRMFARVLVEGRIIENATVIPEAAVITSPRGDYVVFVIKDGKAEMRTVTIGLEKGDKVQIIDGVTAGEMVITAGNLNLKNGAKVSIIKSKEVTTTKENK